MHMQTAQQYDQRMQKTDKNVYKVSWLCCHGIITEISLEMLQNV
jgi:hypothetical protein